LLESGRHPRSTAISPLEIAAAAAAIADQKKGADIRVYDVADHIKVTDFVVLISGLSRPHVKALYDEIHVRLKELGESHPRAEGADLGWWVLMDYVDVVVHIQQPEARAYYELDQLYSHCPEVAWAKVPLPKLEGPPAARLAE
jgi:ribosome silencing factor RsfS/YbeB/iojap